MPNPEIRIEELTSTEDLRQCVAIQRATWGWKDEDLLPLRTLLLLNKIGGLVLGALDRNGQVVGFINAFPGFREGQVYLHSQMLGVLQDFRRRGIGRALKLAQRTEAIRRGIQRIEWTFDPLEIHNAHFNLEGLGTLCRRYVADAYGPSTSSLHGRLPTDRLVAEWHLVSQRVRTRIESGAHGPEDPLPATSSAVHLPADIADIRVRDPARAAAIQRDFKRRVTDLLGKGYCIAGFESASPPGEVSYRLVPFQPQVLTS
ncbi:MAG: GNAT family N-acetyltransferase [Acidobacteria bacterium]|nr:GNAT family N-acetyltransferase [Acidobacteriota bacterium]